VEKKKCNTCGGVKPLITSTKFKVDRNGLSLDIGGIPFLIVFLLFLYGIYKLLTIIF
jgi:hypothetical protein